MNIPNTIVEDNNLLAQIIKVRDQYDLGFDVNLCRTCIYSSSITNHDCNSMVIGCHKSECWFHNLSINPIIL